MSSQRLCRQRFVRYRLQQQQLCTQLPFSVSAAAIFRQFHRQRPRLFERRNPLFAALICKSGQTDELQPPDVQLLAQGERPHPGKLLFFYVAALPQQSIKLPLQAQGIQHLDEDPQSKQQKGQK